MIWRWNAHNDQLASLQCTSEEQTLVHNRTSPLAYTLLQQKHKVVGLGRSCTNCTTPRTLHKLTMIAASLDTLNRRSGVTMDATGEALRHDVVVSQPLGREIHVIARPSLGP